MDGIINVYKEAGYTSHDVVAVLRKILHMKKIGHTGTLDPDAVGVLPVCVGKGTKLCSLLTDHDKEYEAEVLLGVTTDTLDTSGRVLSQSPVSCDKDGLIAVLSEFRGEITQIPPMYSAVKVNGKKLYEYAREGIEVERKQRKVHIYELELTGESIEEDKCFSIRVRCSKGTYIRTLIDDIGRRLGCGAVMRHLTRTKVGSFGIEDALTLDEISRACESVQAEAGSESVPDIILPVDRVFAGMRRAYVTEDGMKRLKNGNPLTYDDFIFKGESTEASDTGSAADRLRVYGADGEFYAVYKKCGNRYMVEKFFH